MKCFLCNNKGHIKEYRPNKNRNNNKKKEPYTADSAMIEAVYEEEIVDGELMNWENLNLNNFEYEYSDEEEGAAMINSVSSSENKRDPFRLNLFHIYLDTCYTFNHNTNNNAIRDIRKVMRGLKSHSNRGVSRTNQKGKYDGFLG